MEPGFIQSKMEIKFLLLYILSRAELPLNRDQLSDAAMCGSGVSYFDLSEALDELVQSDHVLLEQDRYRITEKGRKNGAVTEDEIPYSVRLRCEQRLLLWNEAARQASRVHAAMETTKDGKCLVRLALDGEYEPLFSLELILPLPEDGRQLIHRFQADPHAFFQTLQSLSSTL